MQLVLPHIEGFFYDWHICRLSGLGPLRSEKPEHKRSKHRRIEIQIAVHYKLIIQHQSERSGVKDVKLPK